MLGLFSEDTMFEDLMVPESNDSDSIIGMEVGKKEERHIVAFSRNFKIDEKDYLTMEEVLRDYWFEMEPNGFSCETTLDATRMMVSTHTKENNLDNHCCQYRIQNLKILPFITSLPLPVLKLDALLTLDFSENPNIDNLPPWIGDFESLKHLNLSYTKLLRELPDEIGRLTNLERLDLVDSRIAELPNTLPKLKSLKCLNLRGCEELMVLPSSIGELTNLEELDLDSTTKVKWLPEEIGRLCKLNRLNLSYSNISSLPISMGKLKSLEELNLSSTKHLETIPDDICNLLNLHRLNLSYSNISSIPDKIGQLKQLECLNLHQCRKLKNLPESVRMLELSTAFKRRSTVLTRNKNYYYKNQHADDLDATIDVHQPSRFMCSELM